MIHHCYIFNVNASVILQVFYIIIVKFLLPCLYMVY